MGQAVGLLSTLTLRTFEHTGTLPAHECPGTGACVSLNTGQKERNKNGQQRWNREEKRLRDREEVEEKMGL